MACGQTTLIRDLGNYTFTANRTTYIGLYPSWLTVLRPSSNWDVQAYVATHTPPGSTPSVSALNVTYFDGSRVVRQWRPMAANHSSTLIDSEPASSRSGLVVPSQDSSVFELVKYTGQPAGTTSITAFNGRGSLGWERAGTTLYVPLVKDRWYDRQTEIYVTNVGTKTTQIQVDYYRANGEIYSAGSRTIGPNLQVALNSETYLPNGEVYSAVITSLGQPIAAVVLERDTFAPHNAPALYNAYSEGRTTIYAPLVKKNYGNNTSGITLQNVSNTSVTFTAYYYDMNGVSQGAVSGSIPRFAPYVLYNPGSIPEGFVGAVRVVAGGNIVGEVGEEHKYGLDPRLIYNMPLQGSTTVYLPLWYGNYSIAGQNWASGVNVQNAGSGQNAITATWYDQNGVERYSQPTLLLNSNDTHTFYFTPQTSPAQLLGFVGSVVIRSDSSSNKPIVAVSNIHNWDATSGDSALSFTGSNR